MKRLLFVACFVAGCQNTYSLRLEANPTTPLAADLSSDPITLTEGGIIYGSAHLYDNNSNVDISPESDLELSTTGITTARIFRGPDPNSFVVVSGTPGDTVLEVHYKGRLVQRRNITVVAQ